MGEENGRAEQFSQRCEQLRQSVQKLEESLSVSGVSPLPKLDYDRLVLPAGDAGQLRKENARKQRQIGLASAGAQAFLTQLRPQYTERLELKRREQARRNAVALLKEQQRRQEEEELFRQRRAAEEAARAEAAERAARERAEAEARKKEEEKKRADMRLQSFYAELDAAARPLERVQVQPEG